MDETVNIEKTKIKVKCEGCNKHLMNVVVGAVNETRKNIIQAECPFCGAGSQVMVILGHIYTGPAVKEETNHPTTIVDIDFTETKSIFKIKKAI